MIREVRIITGEKKVGHAGALDPLASGVLVLAIGREFTKEIDNIQAKQKEYIATIKLGVTSTTDDEEGEKTSHEVHHIPDEKDILRVIKEFTGRVEQRPPAFSAIHVNGKRAYKMARAGEEVVLEPREVTIFAIDMLQFTYPLLTIKVTTGPGVYIRALARDIGERLGMGGYLMDLVRTRVGDYQLDDAKTLEELKQEMQ